MEDVYRETSALGRFRYVENRRRHSRHRGTGGRCRSSTGHACAAAAGAAGSVRARPPAV